jgi:hypothetical protein
MLFAVASGCAVLAVAPLKSVPDYRDWNRQKPRFCKPSGPQGLV